MVHESLSTYQLDTPVVIHCTSISDNPAVLPDCRRHNGKSGFPHFTDVEMSDGVPVFDDGIDYWETQPASLDGVLGGFGLGSLPRVDALGSRLFLLNLYPELSTVPSAFGPRNTVVHPMQKRTRALDVGAGIGRVTADVLLHLVTDVVLVEPVNAFIQEAQVCARASALDTATSQRISWPGLADESKSVTFVQDTLQQFQPLSPHRSQIHDRIGYQPLRPIDDTGKAFDVIWCQWCLGYLTNPDLVAFLKRSHEALNLENPRSLIVVKENLCRNDPNGSALEVFDEEDSSLIRSDVAWKALFKLAGLRLVREEVQEGLPAGLYEVKMYVRLSEWLEM